MNENYFLTRRSCRNFSEKKLSETLLEEIIKKASKAPTCGNMQLYSVIATQEPERLKSLASFHYNQPAATSAPLILTICADFHRFTQWCNINKADAGYENFHSFIMALTDAVIFAQQIVTIAEQEGLASCYLGTVTYNAKEISEFLELPKLVVPVASIALGYAKAEGEPTDRLSNQAVLHREKYKLFSKGELEDLYKIHDENPENSKFITENQKDNLAQVFAEVRYPRHVNEEISKNFYDLLKDKGFLGD